jgi:hypothetical protein
VPLPETPLYRRDRIERGRRSLSLFGTGSKNIRTMVRKMRKMLQVNSSFLII